MGAFSVPPLVAPREAEAAHHAQKIMRAAQDFEAVLLGSLLRSLQESLSAVPGEEGAAGTDDYKYLGTQALASALAASGGLGIARMIVRNIVKTEEIRHGSRPEVQPFEH